MNNKIFYLLYILILVGLVDAIYLTGTHYSGQGVNCSLLAGCEKVLTSNYATLYDIPIAAFGVGYYLSLFVLLFFYGLTGKAWMWRMFQLIILIGLLVTGALMYIQIGVLQAVCQYCILSALTTGAIGIVVFRLYLKKDKIF